MTIERNLRVAFEEVVYFARSLEHELTALRHQAELDRETIAGLEKERRFPDIGADPLKLDGDERTTYRSDDVTLARLQKATSLQQKEVPDQTALVWRADLNWLIGQFIWRQAGHRHAITRNESVVAQLALADADRKRREAIIELSGNHARENIISANIINGQNERGGHFWDITRDANFIKKRANSLLAALAASLPPATTDKDQIIT